MSVRAVEAGSPAEYFKQAIEIVKPNWIMLAVATLIIFVIVGALNKVSPLVGGLFGPLLTVPLAGGFFLLVRDSANRQAFDFAKLFSGFTHTPTLINLLIIAAPNCLIGLVQYLMMSAGMVGLSLLLILPLVIYGILATFAIQRVVYAGRDGVTALKESAQGAIANIVPLIVFGLLAMVAAFVGVLALIIGVIFVVPLIYATMMRMHDEVFGFGSPAGGQMAPPPPPPGAPGW
jgi:hypothetical protein